MNQIKKSYQTSYISFIDLVTSQLLGDMIHCANFDVIKRVHIDRVRHEFYVRILVALKRLIIWLNKWRMHCHAEMFIRPMEYHVGVVFIFRVLFTARKSNNKVKLSWVHKRFATPACMLFSIHLQLRLKKGKHNGWYCLFCTIPISFFVVLLKKEANGFKRRYFGTLSFNATK